MFAGTSTNENQLIIHSSKVILKRKYAVKFSETDALASAPDTFLMMEVYNVIAAITGSFTSHATDQTAPTLRKAND